MFPKFVVSILLMAAPFSLMAQSTPKPKPTFEEALVDARQAMVLADGQLSGPGAETLDRAQKQARFVLLGEDHLSREIPQFAGALCAMMKPDAYAVEVGPYAAQFVNGLLHDPDRLAKMAARDKAYPNNMAFLDGRDENDLAARCAAASENKNFAVWGLDQEFIGSPGTLLELMAETHPGPVSMAAIKEAQVKEHAGVMEAAATGPEGFGKLYMFAVTDAEIALLEKAIAEDGNATTRDILRELTESRKIYLLNAQGAPESNLERAELLKLHFLARYRPLKQQLPGARILFKFGDNHTVKGFNSTHELNLGNFVAELAAGEEAQTLHLLALGSRGMHYSIQGIGKPLGQQPFVMAEDPDYKWIAVAVNGMAPQGAKGTTLTVYDLRKLRYRGINMSAEWEKVVYGNDFLILLPELSVSELIQ